MRNAPQTLKRFYSNANRFLDGFMFAHVFGMWLTQTGIRVPRQENAPRGMKFITFANCFVEHFNVLKISPQAWAVEPQRYLPRGFLLNFFNTAVMEPGGTGSSIEMQDSASLFIQAWSLKLLASSF